METLVTLWQTTGLASLSWGAILMIVVGLLLVYLAIVHKFEPLLYYRLALVPYLPTYLWPA